MNFIEELRWRGMLHDMTPGTEELFSKKKVRAYIGFDPTAPSLTIGNYVQIMILKLLQKHGHIPIALMGGATGMIGDPSGKDEERKLKTSEELQKNLKVCEQQVRYCLSSDEKVEDVIVINNYDFYSEINVLDFLRDVGKNLTINYMLSKDSVKNRLDTGMSFTEFSYQLLQANDFLHLYRHHDCKIQLGGSDQWGNITAGTEFIRRNIPNSQAFAATTPLLTKSDGKKFGKSEDGNIWLDSNLTSPYHFYQFWINADDADISKFLRFFSLKSHDEIVAIEKGAEDNPQLAKRLLAEEMTIRLHSLEAYESVLRVSKILFDRKASPEQVKALKDEDLSTIAEEIPAFHIEAEKLEESHGLDDILATETSIFNSKSEVRRAIKSNALSLNKNKITNQENILEEDMWLRNKFILGENGRKNKFILIKQN